MGATCANGARACGGATVPAGPLVVHRALLCSAAQGQPGHPTVPAVPRTPQVFLCCEWRAARRALQVQPRQLPQEAVAVCQRRAATALLQPATARHSCSSSRGCGARACSQQRQPRAGRLHAVRDGRMAARGQPRGLLPQPLQGQAHCARGGCAQEAATEGASSPRRGRAAAWERGPFACRAPQAPAHTCYPPSPACSAPAATRPPRTSPRELGPRALQGLPPPAPRARAARRTRRHLPAPAGAMQGLACTAARSPCSSRALVPRTTLPPATPTRTRTCRCAEAGGGGRVCMGAACRCCAGTQRP